MPELLNVYTKNGIKIGTTEKSKYYDNRNPDTQPWIKCVTCFIIDDVNKKVLFGRRGKDQIDSGKVELCSGHVRCNELPMQCMVRELNEELSITENDSRNLKYLGKVGMDYSLLETEKENHPNLKCLTTVYALKIRDISKIQMDGKEVVQLGWLDIEDAIRFVMHNMTRFASDENSKREFLNIFKQVKEYMFPKQKYRSKVRGKD